MFLIMMVVLFSQQVFGAATPIKQVKLKKDDGTILATLETSAIDRLTGSTFQEIIDGNYSNGLGTIFVQREDACVYEAFAFHKQPNFEAIKTPGLRYFMLLSPKDDAACTIGSVAGMKLCAARKEFVEFMLCANNPDKSSDYRSLACVRIGMSYAYKRGVREKDLGQALYWYKKAKHQNDSLRAQAQAYLYIGLLYKEAKLVPQDLPRARKYFERAAGQSASIGSKKCGLLYLGDIDRLEGHGEGAFLRYLQLIQDDASDSAIKQRAKQRINQMLRGEEYQTYRDVLKATVSVV